MMERLGSMFMHELRVARDFLRGKWGFTPTPQQIMVELPEHTHYSEAKPAPRVDVDAVIEKIRPREGRAYEGVATAFPKELIIPRSEWQARTAQSRRASASRVADALSSHATRKIVERRAKIKEARRLRKLAASN